MYKVVDLFAGAGGLSLGFEMTNRFEVVAFVENNKNAAKTYRENRPGAQNYNDIVKLDFNEIIKKYPNIDVVIGGPPCQGFSNANRQRRKLINGNNELVKRYVEAIRVIKPKVFVMENVKNITSKKHSFCLTEKDMSYIKNELCLKIDTKEISLFEGEEYVDKLISVILNNSYTRLLLLQEDLLYYLKNIMKKRKELKKFFAKDNNIRSYNQLMANLNNYTQIPLWYINIIKDAEEALITAHDQHTLSEENLKKLSTFWDIQRLFLGLQELSEQNAIYYVECINKQIIVKLKTYVVIDYIKAAFKNIGYETKGDVLNAGAYGTPQSRERYVLIGVKKDELGEREISLPDELIKDERKFVTVKEAIGDLEKLQPLVGEMNKKLYKSYIPKTMNFYRELIVNSSDHYVYNHVCTASSDEAILRFKAIKQGENFHSLPDELKKSYENPKRTQNTIYKRLIYNMPSDTVVNVRKSMWIHPVLDRAVSAREAARLQSFPDSYKFMGTKDSVYQQIGNAVPPILGRAVAETVLELLGNKEEYVTLKMVYDKYR